MNALNEYLNDPIGWVVGLLDETATANGKRLDGSLAERYLLDHWDFIQSSYEEAGLNLPGKQELTVKVCEAIEYED